MTAINHTYTVVGVAVLVGVFGSLGVVAQSESGLEWQHAQDTITGAATQEPMNASDTAAVTDRPDLVETVEPWKDDLEEDLTADIALADEDGVNLTLETANGYGATFVGVTPNWAVTPDLDTTTNKPDMDDFVWIETNGFPATDTYDAELTLPDTYNMVYKCDGNQHDPDCTTIDAYEPGMDRPYYREINGGTIVYSHGFSGAGGSDTFTISTQSDWNSGSHRTRMEATDWWTDGNRPGLAVKQLYSDLVRDVESTTAVTVAATNWGLGAWNVNVSLYELVPDDVTASDHEIGTTDENVFSVALGDVTGDGQMDIVSGEGTEGGSAEIILWQNDGTTSSWPDNVIGSREDHIRSVALGDVTGDGRLDIVTGDKDDNEGYGNITLYRNDGTTSDWPGEDIGVHDQDIWSVAVGDITENGRPDIVSVEQYSETGEDGAEIWLWENDGTTGNWPGDRIGVIDTDHVWTVELADITQDGQLDIITGAGNGEVTLWENDGSTSNWPRNTIGTTQQAKSAAVGDVTGNGQPDVVSIGAGDEESDITLWRNDGTTSNWPNNVIGDIDDTPVWGIALGDMNGNSRKDIISADRTGDLVVWENDGSTGDWPSAAFSNHVDRHRSVAVGDITGNGIIDMVTGDHSTDGVTLWENTGPTASYIGSDTVSFTDTNDTTDTATIEWTPETDQTTLLAVADPSTNYTSVFRTQDESSAIGNRLTQNVHVPHRPGMFNGTTVDRPNDLGNLALGYLNGTYRDSGLGKGLEVYYRFDDPDVSSDGGTVQDYSGSGYDATTANNIVTDETGIFGTNAFRSDTPVESEMRVVSDDTGILDGGTELTMSLWVTDIDFDSQEDTSSNILALGDPEQDSTSPPETEAGLRIESRDGDPRQMDFQIFGDSTSSYYPDSGEEDDWHHMVGVYDGSADEIRFYHNGTLFDTDSTDGGPLDTDDLHVVLGEREDGGPYATFDEAMIFDRALSSDEVEDLYFHGIDAVFEGDYTSETIRDGASDAVRWENLTVNASIPPAAQVAAEVRALDSEGSILDTYTIDSGPLPEFYEWVDDFEDGNLDDWYTWGGPEGDPETTQEVTYTGEYAVEFPGNPEEVNYWPGISGFVDSWEPGDRPVRVFIRAAEEHSDNTFHLHMEELGETDNTVEFQVHEDTIQIEESDSGSEETLAYDTDFDLEAGRWYELTAEVGYTVSGEANMTVRDTVTDESWTLSGSISSDLENIIDDLVLLIRDSGEDWYADDIHFIDPDAKYLQDGSHAYPLDLQTSEQAEIEFTGTSTDETKTWEIDEFSVSYDFLSTPAPDCSEHSYDSGDGSSSSPYVIMDAHDLQCMKEDLSASYELGQNIDASEMDEWNGGDGFDPVGDSSTAFTGELDGNGYRIEGMYIDRSGENEIGLFGRIDGATVSNVTVTGEVTGDEYVGGLSGALQGDSLVEDSRITVDVTGYSGRAGGLTGRMDDSATVQSSSVHGDVTAPNTGAGGLTGRADDNTVINDSYATGHVDAGGDYTGGILGYTSGGDGYGPLVINSYATGYVESTGSRTGGLVGVARYGTQVERSYASGNVSGDYYVGGVVGRTEDTSAVVESFATGNVVAPGRGDRVGGLVGRTSDDSMVNNSYATGNASGDDDVGGLIGEAEDNSEVYRSYSVGVPTSNDDIGGLIGDIESGSEVIDSYWDTEASGEDSSDGGTGLTTNQMQGCGGPETYMVGFDFDIVWDLDPLRYPLLAWQVEDVAGSTVDTTGGVVRTDCSGVVQTVP